MKRGDMSKYFHILLTVFLLGTTGFSQQPVRQRGAEFTVPVSVIGGSLVQVLTIGFDPAGTPGFDLNLDVLAPPAPPAGVFDARLSWLGLDYFTDIRPAGVTVDTFVATYTPPPEASLSLSWDHTALPALGTFLLTDNVTGDLFTLDMSTTGTLDVSGNALLAPGVRILVTPLQTAPDIQVSPSSLDFGEVSECDAPQLTLTVSNPGNAPLDVSALTLSGTNAGDLSVLSGGAPFTVLPAASHAVVFQLTPAATGPLSATLTVANNDPDEPLLTVPISANITASADVLGDVNGDGLANSGDALVILSFDVGIAVPPDFLDRIHSGLGDANLDTFTNSSDALVILSFDVGLPVPFPVEEPVCPAAP